MSDRETVLEASWREQRQCHIVYYWNAKTVQANGHFVELQPGIVTFRALGGFDFTIPMGDIVRIDGRNPYMEDSPQAPEPPKERVVIYASGRSKMPNQELSVQGEVQTLTGGHLLVTTADGREFTIPRTQVIRIENPGRDTQPYPPARRMPPLRSGR